MFKQIIEFNPDIYIKNHQGLTPFTLAAKFGRIEVKNLKYAIEINKGKKT